MWKYLKSGSIEILNDVLKNSLNRYVSIVGNKKKANFLLTKEIPADFNDNSSLQELWNQHKKLTVEFCAVILSRYGAESTRIPAANNKIHKMIVTIVNTTPKEFRPQFLRESSLYCLVSSILTPL